LRSGLAGAFLVAVGVLVVAGAVVGGAVPAPKRVASPAPKSVAVTLVDYGFRLSRTVVAPGRVVFKVVNRGTVAHDLVFARGGRTRVLQPGEAQTIIVAFSKIGVYRFFCSVAGHRALGMQGTLRVGSAKAPAPKPPPASSGGSVPPNSQSRDLRLTPVASGLAPLTHVAAPPKDQTDPRRPSAAYD
jgi:plastocyanin